MRKIRVEALSGEQLDTHNAQEVWTYVEGFGAEHFLTGLEWFGGIAAKARCCRGTGDSLYKSRSRIDLVGEALNLHSIETTASSQHDPVSVEAQFLGLHEVELSLHGDRHDYEDGRQGKLHDNQTATEQTATGLRRLPGQCPNGMEPRNDLGRIQAREYADRRGKD